MTNCATISEALDGIFEVDELDGFAATLRDPPPGAIVKQATPADWERIAHMKITFAKKAFSK